MFQVALVLDQQQLDVRSQGRLNQRGVGSVGVDCVRQQTMHTREFLSVLQDGLDRVGKPLACVLHFLEQVSSGVRRGQFVADFGQCVGQPCLTIAQVGCGAIVLGQLGRQTLGLGRRAAAVLVGLSVVAFRSIQLARQLRRPPGQALLLLGEGLVPAVD